jgi:hypothetical protein
VAVPALPAAPTGGGVLPHLIPLLVLLLIFAGLVVRDWKFVPDDDSLAPPDPPSAVEIDPKPQLTVSYHDGAKGDEVDRLMRRATMRFGLSMVDEADEQGNPKRLTYDRWGRSNNTCLSIDGIEILFGDSRGDWQEQGTRTWQEGDQKHEGMKTVWSLTRPPVRVEQMVEIVPGEVTADAKGKLVRRLDTCLVRYRVENADARAHEVGLRFLLDTFIGSNDGVPFVIPGENGLCDTSKEFNGPERVPGYIQAQEKDDLAHPGTVAHVQFQLGAPLDPPDRVVLGAWPDERLGRWLKEPRARGVLTGWDVPVLPIRRMIDLGRRRGEECKADSAVVIYWEPRRLEAGQKREVGFAYGLGKVSASKEEGVNFLLTGDAGVVEWRTFTVQAVVSRPAADQALTLTLPAGLELAGGSATQAVPPVAAGAARNSSTVTWQVKAQREGVYRLVVKSSTGGSQKHPVRVGRKSGIFGSN